MVLVEDEDEMDTATPDTTGQLTSTQKELEELLTKHGDALDPEPGWLSVFEVTLILVFSSPSPLPPPPSSLWPSPLPDCTSMVDTAQRGSGCAFEGGHHQALLLSLVVASPTTPEERRKHPALCGLP